MIYYLKLNTGCPAQFRWGDVAPFMYVYLNEEEKFVQVAGGRYVNAPEHEFSAYSWHELRDRVAAVIPDDGYVGLFCRDQPYGVFDENNRLLIVANVGFIWNPDRNPFMDAALRNEVWEAGEPVGADQTQAFIDEQFGTHQQQTIWKAFADLDELIIRAWYFEASKMASRFV